MIRRALRRSLRCSLAAAAVLIAGSVVRADAPPGQYETFNRSDTCIKDAFTKLTWQRAPLASTQTFAGAATQCAALGTDWRVPSVNELETLVDENPHEELENGVLTPKAIDANAFPGTPVGSNYWTSSVAGGNAWTVDFHDGSTSTMAQSTPLEVRCVVASPSSTPTACQ